MQHFVTLNSSQNSSKGALTREMFFNTWREISRYLEAIPVSFCEIVETNRKVTNLRAQSCRQVLANGNRFLERRRYCGTIRKTGGWVTKKNILYGQAKLVHNFIAIFHFPNYLGSQWRSRLIPQLRVSSDLTGNTGESVQTPGKPV